LSYPEPNLNKPLLTENRKAFQSFRLWIQNVTRKQLFRGTTNPEDNQEAVEDALFVNTTSNVLFYKKENEESGDKSKGWEAVGGSVQRNTRSVTSATTLLATDYTVICNGTFTVSLLTAVGLDGREFLFKNIGTGTVTIDPDGSETIDSNSTIELLQNDALTIQSDGANWIIV
jgi:hypothetical protein